MKLIIVFIAALFGGGAQALDLCTPYSKVHQREVMTKLKSGIPFRLVSILQTTDGNVERAIRVRQDLWTEKIEVQIFGQTGEWVAAAEADRKICSVLIPDEVRGKVKKIDVLLNPSPLASLDRIAKQVRESKKGLVQVDLEKISAAVDTERVLLTLQE